MANSFPPWLEQSLWITSFWFLLSDEQRNSLWGRSSNQKQPVSYRTGRGYTSSSAAVTRLPLWSQMTLCSFSLSSWSNSPLQWDQCGCGCRQSLLPLHFLHYCCSMYDCCYRTTPEFQHHLSDAVCHLWMLLWVIVCSSGGVRRFVITVSVSVTFDITCTVSLWTNN